MRESTAAKKTIHSGEQAAFASRQLDNTHRVKVERGREAASPLRRREGGGLSSRRSRRQNSQKTLPHTHTHAHTQQSPLLPPSSSVQMTSLRETNKHDVPRGKPASPLFTPYSSSLRRLIQHSYTRKHTHIRSHRRICHSEDAKTRRQESSQKLSKIFSGGETKKNTSMSRMFTVRERERRRESEGESGGGGGCVLLIGVLKQPSLAANQRSSCSDSGQSEKRAGCVSVAVAQNNDSWH